jgi:hypothetical protein
MGLAPYHDFEGEIPAELDAEVQDIVAGIIAGEINTGWPVGAEPEAAAPIDFKVGMVSDVGGVDDASFNENTWPACSAPRKSGACSSSRARPRRTMRKTSLNSPSRDTIWSLP